MARMIDMPTIGSAILSPRPASPIPTKAGEEGPTGPNPASLTVTALTVGWLRHLFQRWCSAEAALNRRTEIARSSDSRVLSNASNEIRAGRSQHVVDLCHDRARHIARAGWLRRHGPRSRGHAFHRPDRRHHL